ncbi:hypothetical protein ACIA6C_27955 [Streptomyces sp. NPDC051578]|uniref:hypothetical protein n=1 Tax=Streptomyces sp. NPDC051578 TaxID=3365662 RepID=UPI0037ACAB21
MTDHEFLVEVLTIFAKAESHDTLLWWAKGDSIELWANVSDIFDWGSADAEAITPDRLPILQQALADLIEAGSTAWLAELYAARIRGMRPQGAAYPAAPGVQALLNACGPARATGLGNPKPIPEPAP